MATQKSPSIIFDNRDQYQRIQQFILPNEELYMVYDLKDGGTEFVGITDLRLIFMDQSFVGRNKAIVSLPYTKITALGAFDSGDLEKVRTVVSSSKLQIVAGSREWTFEFLLIEKASTAHQLIIRNLLQTEIGSEM